MDERFALRDDPVLDMDMRLLKLRILTLALVSLAMLYSSQVVAQETDTSAVQEAPCGAVQWAAERPGEGAGAEAWKAWFKAQVEGDGRGLVAAKAREPKARGASFWLLAVRCGGAKWLWGVDVGAKQVRERFYEKVYQQYCCGATGAEPGEIERVDFNDDGAAEFVVRAKWAASGGVDYMTTGKAILLVFPDHRIERTWRDKKPPSSEVTYEVDGEEWKSTFDGPAWAVERYNPRVEPGNHVLAITESASYSNDVVIWIDGEGEAEEALKSHFCRRIRTKLQLPNTSGAEKGAVSFRQEILAPAGEGGCGMVLFADGDEEKLWSKSSSLGTISGTFEFREGKVRVKIEENVDEGRW